MPESSRPTVACYCATFLKPEMLHIYRQISALEQFRAVVITQKRENLDRFPFQPVFLIGKPSLHFLRRFWFRTVREAPWQISRREVLLIKRVLDDNDAKLLHVYFGHIAVHLLPLILHWRHPTVVSFHGADVMVELDKPHFRAATREMLAAARLVLVRAESLARALIALGCPAEKIRLQRTGIPLDQIPFRERSQRNDGQWNLLQAGRLIEKKGFETSLRAFATFRKKHPDAHFTIAGEGPMLPDLRTLTRELGLEDSVCFAGFLPQARLREAFYQSDIFVHPSELGPDGNQEGVPNSMLEAMASGLPVFATNHGGIPEAIDHGVSGVLVPERSHETLADELLEWTERPRDLQQLARMGARVVADKFEQRGQVRALEAIYDEALL